MEKITAENCIPTLIEQFPDFLPYWELYIEKWGADEGISIQMFPLADYIVDAIKNKNDIKIKKIFDFVEFVLCNGDQSIQDAIATSLLEDLLNRDPKEIQFVTFAKYLGENTIDYCRGWDEFTGVKTKGLWDFEKPC
jgi:hypothetical protein